MHNAGLYKRYNELQRRDAKQTIDDYSHLIQWRPDGLDSLLDIGCGCGDVTIDFIMPMLPSAFTSLVGADISDEMLHHARDDYQQSKISFEKLDIGRSLEASQFVRTPFDHITSFYCLHWVQNQKQAVQNIYDLLAADGDCLLVFLAFHPVFEIYHLMCEQPQWARYASVVSNTSSPYQFSSHPADEFGRILHATGFAEYSVEVLDKLFIYEGIDILQNSIRAVTPFFDRMPKDRQEQFLHDFIEIMCSMKLVKPKTSDHNNQFMTPYKLIVAYASK